MSSYTHWQPFELACRLRVLQQGSLVVGNTRQNIAHLQALCISNANGAATYARWSTAANMKAGTVQALEVLPANVPGFVRPVAS